ncbi:glycosyltransferase family 61 protein [Sulfitobacter sp.]|uniref:glycosyltransferase family 61 protein n=1 Tax=Sulfitobacter sp. TaxID=1903071 RepID=UPI0030032081
MPDIFSGASDTWEVAPSCQRHVPAAVCLPGQLERIKDTEFAPIDVVIRSFLGEFDTQENPTIGYRLENVDMVDGVLYAKGRQRHLRARHSRSVTYPIPRDVMSGSMYESWLGNRWFGNWLSDDCLTYFLTNPAGTTVTTSINPTGHVPCYEALLGMAPLRRQNVHFSELILFDDHANNAGKTQRTIEMRDKLLFGRAIKPVNGVFLLRGKTGDARVMTNERQIADQMAETYGFHVLDPTTASVDQIADLCGNAAIVAGVEGSHLVHGLAVMPPGATLLVFQPPDRTVAALKTVTDRQNQGYAFVVGEGTSSNFSIDWSEVRRTLDLLD